MYYNTHDPRHRSYFVPVIVSGKEYPKGTCLAPSFFLIVREKEVIALFLKEKTKLSLLCKTNIIIIILLLLLENSSS